MTLVATYRENCLPVIFADMMITARSNDIYPASFPAVRRDTKLDYSKIPHNFNAHRKIFQINQNIIVGWSGNYASAKAVYMDMVSYFRENETCHEALEIFFKGQKNYCKGNTTVSMTGWIIGEDQVRNFCWHSSTYYLMAWEEEKFVIGSGAVAFEKYYGVPTLNEWNDSSGKLVTAQASILGKLGNFYLDTQTNSDGYLNGYGVGYEAFYLDDSNAADISFRPLDNYSIIFMPAAEYERGAYRIFFPNDVVKIQYVSGLPTIVRIHIPNATIEAKGGNKIIETFVVTDFATEVLPEISKETVYKILSDPGHMVYIGNLDVHDCDTMMLYSNSILAMAGTFPLGYSVDEDIVSFHVDKQALETYMMKMFIELSKQARDE
ncbi:hypothetical protein [Hoeflea sp. TYP-13]|uniref:hypothetical protein n=1 Tax=Hoeflea sp. TYP-13 TaxID=3230023 RepID=UPI0034C66897